MLFLLFNKIVFWPGAQKEEAQDKKRTKQASRQSHESQRRFAGWRGDAVCGKENYIASKDSCAAFDNSNVLERCYTVRSFTQRLS